MFGGDYFDWTKAENKEAIQFMKDMVDNNQTPIDQIADKYEQMNPKINDGKYGSFFMWGLGTDYKKAGMLGDDKIHMAMVPDFSGKGERAIFTDSWNYVLNSASKNKEAAIKFLKYMTEEGGMEASYKAFERYPARADIAEKLFRIQILQKKYIPAMLLSATLTDVRCFLRQWNLSQIWELFSSHV